MTIFEFNEQLCEIIAGEDGYYNYDKQEILDLAKQMKTSAEEYQNMLECRDACEVHDLMNDTRELGNVARTKTKFKLGRTAHATPPLSRSHRR